VLGNAWTRRHRSSCVRRVLGPAGVLRCSPNRRMRRARSYRGGLAAVKPFDHAALYRLTHSWRVHCSRCRPMPHPNRNLEPCDPAPTEPSAEVQSLAPTPMYRPDTKGLLRGVRSHGIANFEGCKAEVSANPAEIGRVRPREGAQRQPSPIGTFLTWAGSCSWNR
jgi:hypothetical protein